MAVVDDGVVGERAEVGQSAVHLLAGALEEAPAPRDEERVAGEYAARVRRRRGRGDMEADRVLRMAGRREASVEIRSVLVRMGDVYVERAPDVDPFADFELVLVFDELCQCRDFITASVNGSIGEGGRLRVDWSVLGVSNSCTWTYEGLR